MLRMSYYDHFSSVQSIFELFFRDTVYTLVHWYSAMPTALRVSILRPRRQDLIYGLLEITGREVRAVEWVWEDLYMKFLQIRLHHCRTLSGCIIKEFVCLFVLRFYGPVNPMGSCRARSVYRTTRLLGRLSKAGNQYCAHSFARN